MENQDSKNKDNDSLETKIPESTLRQLEGRIIRTYHPIIIDITDDTYNIKYQSTIRNQFYNKKD